MRFSVPRSLSPSPVRKTRSKKTPPRNSSSFGLKDSDSEDSSEYDDEYPDDSSEASDSESTASSSSSDSFCYGSDSEVPQRPPKPRQGTRTVAEERYIEDTVAAIRLRTRHHDPYEDWERKMRREAFRTARQEHKAGQSQRQDEQERLRTTESRRLAQLHEQQMAEVKAQLEALRVEQIKDEIKLREGWNRRDKLLWQRIEAAIKLDEDKVAAKLAEEKRVREEAEKKRQGEELKRRLEEEKRKNEEERKRKEAEEAKRLKEEEERKEQEDLQRQLVEETERAKRLKAEEQQRKEVGLSTAEEDWRKARNNLRTLKGVMKNVKETPELKSIWGTYRRKITPKIGQLTNDQEAINHISQQIYEIIIPPSGAHYPPVYNALLSSLSKAILMQAETEVTAEKRSAGPLSQVAFNLLEILDGFPQVFFAKLMQRVGSWPIPCKLPLTDVDGRPWADAQERKKVSGYRKSTNDEISARGDGLETEAEHTTRVAGIMRVYFGILRLTPTRGPLRPMFQMPRIWTWLARVMGDRDLLRNPIAAELIYTALDVFGSDAKHIWGQQFVKMLAMIYEGVKVGLGDNNFIGGVTPEGKAARVRTELAIERVMKD